MPPAYAVRMVEVGNMLAFRAAYEISGWPGHLQVRPAQWVGDLSYKGKYSALIPLFSQCTIATLRSKPKRGLPA